MHSHLTSETHLRVAPPAFPPSLNSYQRLLIHRLADMWNLTRELETSSSPQTTQQQPQTLQRGAQGQAAIKGSEISGIIVLVKNERTQQWAILLLSERIFDAHKVSAVPQSA